jgi:hypothetical protein
MFEIRGGHGLEFAQQVDVCGGSHASTVLVPAEAFHAL